MYRTLVTIIGCLLGTLLLVGLTFSSTSESRAEFSFINGTEPKTLDPHLATGEPEGRILRSIFEGLTRLDARSLTPVGGVAERWSISPDGKRYEFEFRRNARWTDGRPVTPGDFIYSWRRVLDPALGSEYSYLLHGIEGARALNTYGAHVAALRGAIPDALGKLERSHGGAVPLKDWRAFLADTHAHDALQRVRDERVTELLARTKGQVEKKELSAFRRAMALEAKDLASAQKVAQRRFGKELGVYAASERRLVVELEAPMPYFLELLSFYPTFPVPRWVLETEGDQRDWFLPEKIVSNGPFVLKKWIVNDRIRLERSSSYWGKEQVMSRTIDAYSMENVTTSLNMYLTGEVDWVPKQYPEDLVPKLKQRSDFYAEPGMVIYYYMINCTRPPLDDPRVRQAINLAIDRTEITRDVLGRGELPAGHIVPPGMPDYTPPETNIRFDIARAKELLAEAGYGEGRGFRKIGILYNTFEAHKKIAEVISDQLRRNLGLEVEAYNQEWQSYLVTRRTLDYDLARAGWIGDYRDPNTFLDIWVTNGGNNQTGFASPRYDVLIRAAANIGKALSDRDRVLAAVDDRGQVERWMDAAASGEVSQRLAAAGRLRMGLLAEAEKILVQQEFPIIPIYFYVNSGLVRDDVRGFFMQLELPDGSRSVNLQDVHPLYAIHRED